MMAPSLPAKTLQRLRPRTLIFCTAYADNYHTWLVRYRRWLEGIRRSGLEYDQILLIDDCSPVLPNWPDLALVRADDATVCDRALVMARFQTHLGRIETPDYCTSPGWFRSF